MVDALSSIQNSLKFTMIVLSLAFLVSGTMKACMPHPAPAGEIVRDSSGQTVYTIHDSPRGREVRTPNGKTQYVIRPDPYNDDGAEPELNRDKPWIIQTFEETHR